MGNKAPATATGTTENPETETESQLEKEIPPGGRLHVMTMAGDDYRFSFDLRASQRAITHLVDNLSDEEPVEGNMLVTTIYPHLYGQLENPLPLPQI